MSRIKSEPDRCRGELAEYCLMESLLQYDRTIPLKQRIDTLQYGKPYFLDIPIEFSLSHAGEFAVSAISDLPVGIDIERVRPVRESLAKRICTDQEWNEVWLKKPDDKTFLALFSGKESIVKRSGRGLSDMTNVEVARFPVMQTWILDYVLSVCSERIGTAEVISLCE